MRCGLWPRATESTSMTLSARCRSMSPNSTRHSSASDWTVLPNSKRAYLRAMAGLRADPQKASDVAEVMGRRSSQIAPTRAELIAMGLLYTPCHGYAAFTVPHFDQFIIQAIPTLQISPIRGRRPSRARES
jgi:predicted transcriptional regulator